MTTKQTVKKWHGPCIYKVQEKCSPHSKTFVGFRMIVAVPNMNGHEPFGSEPAPSFAKAFQLFIGSDWTVEEVEGKVKGAIKWLLNRGFDSVEPAEVYAQRMRLAMAKGNGTQHKEAE